MGTAFIGGGYLEGRGTGYWVLRLGPSLDPVQTPFFLLVVLRLSLLNGNKYPGSHWQPLVGQGPTEKNQFEGSRYRAKRPQLAASWHQLEVACFE